MKRYYIIVLILSLALFACRNTTQRPNLWGTTNDSIDALDNIITHGELIMVTLSGPETYYDYHGKGLGLHYLLCEKLCKTLGVALRTEVCKDTTELLQRVERGEADIIALPMREDFAGLENCGSGASGGDWHWLVSKDNPSLALKVNEFLTAEVIKKTTEEQDYWLSPQSIKRTVYAPVQNKAKGIISNYDYLFQRYAPAARWDWRLLAAQCYQESTFDPRAHSWAGACGLMQIMPSTADHLQLARADIYDPEKNVAAAAKYIAELTQLFSDIDNPTERIKFVLASYNGGNHHIRDAMALTKKYGGNMKKWSDVKVYILRLSTPAYYNDPVVKYGYMRGSETANYVDKIIDRWEYYRGVKTSIAKTNSAAPSPITPAPQPAKKRKSKYNI